MTNAITDWVLVLAPTDTFVASSQKYIYIYIYGIEQSSIFFGKFIIFFIVTNRNT